MKEGAKEAIAKIIDESSGGLKGLDLLVRLMRDGFTDLSNPDDHDLEVIADMVRKELPEFDVLEYGMDLGGDTVRLKYFFYRKLHSHCCRE